MRLDQAEKQLASPLLGWNGFCLFAAHLRSSRRTLIRIGMRAFLLVLLDFPLELCERLADSFHGVVTFLLCRQRASSDIQDERRPIQGPRRILLNEDMQ